MLERELTLQEGTIAKNLPEGVVWLRLGDTGKTTYNKLGCDGFIFHGLRCWITEVKMNNEKLTQSEENLRDWCISRKVRFIILRFHEKYGLWEIEIAGANLSYTNSSLKECVEDLID